MRKIKIGFSYPKKFMPFAWLIKLYTREPFSHVYVEYLDEITGQEMMAESSHGEFHKITKENWLGKNTIINEFDIDISDDSFYLIMRHINNHLQVDYSVTNIFGIPFYDLYELTNWKIFLKIAKLFTDGASRLICSESVSFILIMLGIEFNRPSDFLRPDHIYEALLEYKA